MRGDGEFRLAHVPVPEQICHELSRLRDHFVRRWLFFDDDPAAAHEVAALRAPTAGEARQYPRVAAGQAAHRARGVALRRIRADINVLICLSERWPIDFEADA